MSVAPLPQLCASSDTAVAASQLSLLLACKSCRVLWEMPLGGATIEHAVAFYAARLHGMLTTCQAL